MTEPIEIEGFRVIERIGGGSTGDVYRAEQIKMDRMVAIKILPPILTANEMLVTRFMKEARALARLRHENIVTAFDAGRSGDVYFLAMEYVKGNTLGRIIERGGALDERRAARLGAQIADALDHASRQGMVHRDIKPQNIIVGPNGAAKLCDMGFAKVLAQAEDLGEGRTLGTPSYISPEQAKGDIHVDTRSDIYSLGATLFHAVTGSPPFSGKSAADIMMKHILEHVEPPHERSPGVEEGISFIIKKMLRKNPDRRYQRPGEAAKDLEAFAEGRFEVPSSWFSDSSLTLRAQKVDEPERSGSHCRKKAPRRKRRRRR